MDCEKNLASIFFLRKSKFNMISDQEIVLLKKRLKVKSTLWKICKNFLDFICEKVQLGVRKLL